MLKDQILNILFLKYMKGVIRIIEIRQTIAAGIFIKKLKTIIIPIK